MKVELRHLDFTSWDLAAYRGSVCPACPKVLEPKSINNNYALILIVRASKYLQNAIAVKSHRILSGHN